MDTLLAVLLPLTALIAAANDAASDYWVFGAGLVAGALIAVALRRDLRAEWDGRERRRRAQ